MELSMVPAIDLINELMDRCHDGVVMVNLKDNDSVESLIARAPIIY